MVVAIAKQVMKNVWQINDFWQEPYLILLLYSEVAICLMGQ